MFLACNTSEFQYLVLQRQLDDDGNDATNSFNSLSAQYTTLTGFSSSRILPDISKPLNITDTITLWKAALEETLQHIAETPIFSPYYFDSNVTTIGFVYNCIYLALSVADSKVLCLATMEYGCLTQHQALGQ